MTDNKHYNDIKELSLAHKEIMEAREKIIEGHIDHMFLKLKYSDHALTEFQQEELREELLTLYESGFKLGYELENFLLILQERKNRVSIEESTKV